MISKYIIPFYFFIALFIGLFIAYISTPVPDIIIKYPTPQNAGKIVYKDDSDVCYKYKVDEVNCPKDLTKVKEIGEIEEKNKDQLNSVKTNMESFLTNLNNKYSPY
jgi:hypothetical protein